MNKKNWIIAIVVVIVIIIVALIVGRSTNTAKAPENSSSTVAASTTKPISSSTANSSSSGLTITQTGFYGNKDYSFNYPTNWTISTYSPFSMTNFKGKYQNGGIIPPGGAEIDVVTTTISGSLKDIMTTELMSATNLTTTNITVNHVACSEATYQNTYNSSLASKDVAVYCQRGTEVWKIYLSYRADDSTAAAHITDFNSVLASMKLL